MTTTKDETRSKAPTRITLDQQVQEFLSALHRNGNFRFVQNLNALVDGVEKPISIWFRDDEPITIPAKWNDSRSNLFFGVSPSSVQRGAYNASRLADIQVLNCFYAEFDGKDFTNPSVEEIEAIYQELYKEAEADGNLTVREKKLFAEATGKAKLAKYATNPEKYRTLALNRLLNAFVPASVIVDSGGGYQAYWLLAESFLITDENRDEVKSIQKRWVQFVGGDPGVHDIRRILRVPGTYNHKKKYAPNFPLVSFYEYDLDQRYVFTDLVDLLPSAPPEPSRPVKKASTAKEIAALENRTTIDALNEDNDIRDLLVARGYTRTGNPDRLSRPGEPESKGLWITPDNRAYPHSSNDPLWSGDEHARDCFDVLMILDHSGDFQATLKAVKISYGVWVEKKILPIIKTQDFYSNGNGAHAPNRMNLGDGRSVDQDGEIHNNYQADDDDIDQDDRPEDEELEDWEKPAPSLVDLVTPAEEKLTLENLNPLAYRSEDGGIMDAWIDLNGDDWRFIVGPDQWRSWNETHWTLDKELSLPKQIITLLNNMNLKCEELAKQNGKRMRKLKELGEESKEAKETAKEEIDKIKKETEPIIAMLKATKRSGGRVNSIESLCQKMKALDADQLNKDDSLNMHNGVFSLSGLSLRDHSREDLFTYCLDYDFEEDATCPQFLKFLSEVLVKDPKAKREKEDDADLWGETEEKEVSPGWETDHDLISLFQELLGYSLTTHVKREVMAWMFGDGGNGKSVVIAIIEALLGGLASSIDFQSLGTPGNYEMSDIPGKRVIFATEADRGGPLAEKYIKQIVSGDTLKARPIYGTQFEFRSTAKIWWAMNDKPMIRDTSDAIWRRMKLIPFYRQFQELTPNTQADPTKTVADVDLLPKLMRELPGILNWAIEGLIRLKKNNRFTYCEAAENAKKRYREESNPVQRWVKTCCVSTNYPSTLGGALFANYVEWARSQAEKPITSTQFGNDLKRLKIPFKRVTKGIMYSLGMIDNALK